MEQGKCEICGCDPCECGEIDIEDSVEQNELLLHSLIELLIEKGVITQQEFDSKVEKLENEWYEDEETEEEQQE